MSEPRHVSFSEDPKALALQSAENARDTIRALSEKVSGRLVTMSGYAATGSTSQRIPLLSLPSAVRPRAVLPVRVSPTYDPALNLAAVPILNFYHDSIGVGVYEPSGLTPNEKYDFVFLVLE